MNSGFATATATDSLRSVICWSRKLSVNTPAFDLWDCGTAVEPARFPDDALAAGGAA